MADATAKATIVYDVPSAEDLLSLYRSNKSSYDNYNPPIEQIVDVLGGLDTVLEIMLSAPNHNMKPSTRLQMYTLLAHSPAISSIAPMEEHLSKWTLDRDDNVIHSLSPCIAQHLYSKRALSLLTLFLILPEVLMLLLIDKHSPAPIDLGDSAVKWFLTFQLIAWWIFPIPWTIAALLSVNKKMWIRIAKNTETWIITGTGLLTMFYSGIYNLVKDESNTYLVIHILSAISGGIIVVLFHLWICAIDGIGGWHRNSKVILLTILAAPFAFFSMYWEYFMDDQTVQFPMLGEEGKVSLTAKIASSFWVIFLFMAKMALNAWRRGDRQCVAVKEFPYIEWTNGNNNNDRNPSATMSNAKMSDGATDSIVVLTKRDDDQNDVTVND